MKAIIVPGVTDLNKGDQALVWESYRLVNDTHLFSEILILDSGDTPHERELLCNQTEKKGFFLIQNILPHPRRGKHKDGEYITESKMELAKQVYKAINDFIKTKAVLLFCNQNFLTKILFSQKIYHTINKFKESDIVFVKGGGFIHAYGEKTAPYLMWYLLFYIRLAVKLNKKVVFLPNSFGPFEGTTVKRQVKSVFKNLDIIYARENVSAKQLGDLLGKCIPVEMDLGFFLQKSKEEKAIQILDKYNLSKNDKIIGITIRPWRFPGKSNPKRLYDNYIKSFVDLIEYVCNLNYKVALCNQSLGPNTHEDDRNAIQDVLCHVKHHNLIWINENLDCQTLKTVYSFFYSFVGTRFHSIIFSLTSNVPSIAIAYGGNKAQGIMNDIDLEKFVLNIDSIDSESLIHLFDQIISEREEIKNKLQHYIKICNESRNRIISTIVSLFN